MKTNGWTLLFHECLIEQVQLLLTAADRAEAKNPYAAQTNTTVKLANGLTDVMLDVVPLNPGGPQYLQGNTLGRVYRHWRRVKIGRRFRLFFRYDSVSRIIVYVWVNDLRMLRASGSLSDPYSVFSKMLSRGYPPDDWDELVRTSRAELKLGD